MCTWFVPTLHWALIATAAFLFIHWKEILTRWRHTGPHLAVLLFCTYAVHFCGARLGVDGPGGVL